MRAALEVNFAIWGLIACLIFSSISNENFQLIVRREGTETRHLPAAVPCLLSSGQRIVVEIATHTQPAARRRSRPRDCGSIGSI